jgi:hypothetical protein
MRGIADTRRDPVSTEPMSRLTPFVGPIGRVDLLLQERQGFEKIFPHPQKQNGAVTTELLHDGSCIGLRDFILRFLTRGRPFMLRPEATSLVSGFLARNLVLPVLRRAEHPHHLGVRDTLAPRRAPEHH